MPAEEFMLQPQADWRPAEWASAEIQAVIDVRAAAEIKRGINLGLGGEIGASLAAMVANYVAVDLSAEAHASVELKGQAQVLLDLFDEVGVAIRLRAAAELGASVKLGIGLSTREFIDLAKEIDLIGVDSVQMELLEALLDESVFEAGVAGKAALSAMAYANLSITGRLIRKSESDGAGFFLVGDVGAGLEGGAGYQMFAKVGLREPSRLIRRTVDIAVDRTIAKLEPFVAEIDKPKAEQAVRLLWQLRAPAKMAMRIAYETGMALSQDSKKKIHSNFSKQDIAKEVALRCVKIAVEEAQPYVLELLLQWAIERFRKEAGLKDDAWDRVAGLLTDQRPPEPFSVAEDKIEPNLAYWNEVLQTLDELVAAENDIQASVAPYLAVAWGAIQLLFIVARFSQASSRETDPPEIYIETTFVPPESVITAISHFLGKPSAVAIDHKMLTEFITKKTSEYFDGFVEKDSGAETILRILVGGKDRPTLERALGDLIEHAGAAYPSKNQRQLISLETVQQGLKWYMQKRVETQLKPVVKKCDGDELLKNMFTDVLIASLAFTTDRIITAVLEYSEKNETAIREACSAILMRLLARSLVVTTDVLVATTMQEIQRAMRDFDEHLDPVIDKLDNAYKTDHVADVLHETIAISAEVFDASGATYQRARPEIRELLYKLIDGHMQLPAPDEIPHKEALVKLATHIVTLLEQNLVGFAEALLRLLEERLYDKFQDIVNEVNQQVDEWKQEITAVHAKIHDQVIWVEKQLAEFETKIEKSVNLQVQQTNNMIDDVSAHPEQIRAQLRKALHNEAMKSAPKEAHLKQVYTQAVDGAIGTVGEKAIASMVVASCKSFKQDRELINAFLRDARQLSHSKSIAKCFGGHQGKIVARQLQMTIPFPKLVPLNPLTVKVPEKAVRAAFGTGAGLSANLVTMADALMALFSEQTKSESSRKETTDESAKVKQKEATTQRLIEARAADDAKVEIVYPPANAFIPAGVDAAIKIRLENVPVEYLARQSLEQPRLLIWVNQVLVDLQSIEPDLQANAFTLTFSPDSLRYGPNRVTVMLADSNLPQESVGFFREVPKTENNKGLGISDNDIMDGIHQAQEYLRAKTKKAITEASDLVK